MFFNIKNKDVKGTRDFIICSIHIFISNYENTFIPIQPHFCVSFQEVNFALLEKNMINMDHCLLELFVLFQWEVTMILLFLFIFLKPFMLFLKCFGCTLAMKNNHACIYVIKNNVRPKNTFWVLLSYIQYVFLRNCHFIWQV